MPASVPVLIDETQAAAILGLSRRTLQAWRVSGAGPVYRKIGCRVLYAEADIADFIAASRRHHTSETRARA